jgi:hypothetical protein
MAQKQFTNYQDDILSFDLREAMLGVLKPGRYCGFDTATHVSTGSGIINIHLSHAGSGIQKGSKANPPVLGNKTGVAVTTQGVIIHDNATDIDVAIDDGSGNGGSTRYDVIYLEHIYLDGTPGDNPATYGIKKGTPGAGIPSLTSPNKQVGLMVITIPNGSTTFGALGFAKIQYELGDLSLLTVVTAMLGSLTGYSEENYITDGESVTNSLNELDMHLKDASDAIGLLQATKLDDWATPDDNTDLNASSSKHGLLPKLSNVVTQFLNGQGGWTAPTGQRLIMRTGTFNVDTTLTDSCPSANEINFGGIAASDAVVLVIRYHIQTKVTFPDGQHFQVWASLVQNGSYQWFHDLINELGSAHQMQDNDQFIIPCSSSQKFWLQVPSASYLDKIELTCVGWQTAL